MAPKLSGTVYHPLSSKGSLDEECGAEHLINAHGPRRASEHAVPIETSLSPRVQRYVQNFSLAFLTVQQTLNPIMVRAAHKISQETKQEFLSSTTVFTTEILKVCLCCITLCFSHGSVRALPTELWNTFVNNKRETIKVCIPALIYVIQNNLYFFALKRVEATLFSVTYQLRILTTALLSVLLLRRIFSMVQWSALFISLVGVILVQTSSQQNRSTQNDTEESRRNELIGLVTVIVMCWSSAFAGVYLEGVLKKSSCDILLQNIRLSVITLPFSVMTMANDRAIIEQYGLFYGWSWLVWSLALSSAVSGIVVAAVMKYADNIKKSYCQSMALGGTAFLSIALGDSKFSYTLLAGISLVIVSVFLYTINPTLTAVDDEDFEEVFYSDDEVEAAMKIMGEDCKIINTDDSSTGDVKGQ
ncbi:nucleotide-sugar transporter domain-containing protein [Ditylenchus destructor]|uniref:Nucleotide-sugar transporter domain-containing protein n=1 Tax=Ditylenchus destructor TaxID=166010 RepID=A0AAD4NCT8_9BILA|nr:nucleotide-sugar transporter domain-containing protein [Ditylenchus destructor]